MAKKDEQGRAAGTPDSIKRLGRAEQSIGRYLIGGLVVILFLAGGVGGWAASSSISGAVIAPGKVVVGSHRKEVQHLTGGIVGKILVMDGQHVERGQVVLRLDATLPKANLAIIRKQLDELHAGLVRLRAEMRRQSHLTPTRYALKRRESVYFKEALAGQKSLFEARRATLEGQVHQLDERIQQLGEEISGLEAQRVAKQSEIVVIDKELAGLTKLSEKGLVPVSRMMRLQREAARIRGEVGRLTAEIARSRSKIGETRIEVIQLAKDRREKVVADLRDTQAKISELEERYIAAADQLRRIDIRAPIGGYVHNLDLHAAGAVIAPGQMIMEIVPSKDALMVEARIDPRDIDQVQTGQTTRVRFTSFGLRDTPELTGTVERISPDLERDDPQGPEYYKLRILVAEDEIARLDGRELLPGMPAEAFIQTGERTALSYLLKPLSDHFERAFREE